MRQDRFQCFKVSTCGNQVRWGYVTGLTHDQARDQARFPYGRQMDPDGRPYSWGVAVMPRYLDG